MKAIYRIATILGVLALSASCDKFLDTMPDNRAEIDSQSKIRALLTSAYPATDYMLITEFMSDNVDDYGKNNPNTDRFIDQVFAWDDVTETDNESPENLWESSYISIAAANQALEAIEEMGGAEATGMKAERAEALLCRAYNHFILANVFCMAYSSATADSDLGLPYITHPETSLIAKYERGTLAETYKKIEEDLVAALPDVSDSYYTVPKYHFNARAAYAFAARFYLYYEKFEESVKWANRCLGAQPATMLRDWAYQAEMTQQYTAIVEHYVSSSLNANLLLMTAYSKMGLAFGPYMVYTKYSHGGYLSELETGEFLPSLWGGSNNTYYMPMKIYGATNLDRVIFWKIPYLFEYTDPVAQIGYYRAVYPAFSTDQVLLERAEANALLGNYDLAIDDLNIWIRNIAMEYRDNDDGTETLVRNDVTAERIGKFFGPDNMEYCTWDHGSPKKHLHPHGFSIGEEGEFKELLLQCVLSLKRLDALGQGLRWFDVKRYNIEIERRVINAEGFPAYTTGKLVDRDPRYAVQIPLKVRDAGLEPNPRVEASTPTEGNTDGQTTPQE